MIYPRDLWLGMEEIWEQRVGNQNLRRASPIRSIIDVNGAVAFGTDWPIVDFNPLVGIRNSILRRSQDKQPEGGWVPQQAITLKEALHACTLGAAFACHREQMEVSLTGEKLPDFIVLCEDILALDPGKLTDVSVVRTVVRGKTVWRACRLSGRAAVQT